MQPAADSKKAGLLLLFCCLQFVWFALRYVGLSAGLTLLQIAPEACLP